MRRYALYFIAALLTFALGGATVSLLVHRLQSREPANALLKHTAVSEKKTLVAANECGHMEQLSLLLPQFYDEYKTVEKAPTIEKLIALDEEVRRLVNNRPDYYPCDDTKICKVEYDELGVYICYDGFAAYSGKLLTKAHKINPRSKYRKYTLFSAVQVSDNDLGVMPNVKAARQYAGEFPDGPFIEETLSILANFHKDLFMVLRNDLQNSPRDYKYDCFRPYINKSSRFTQMNRAKSEAINFYKKVLAVDPSNKSAAAFLTEISNDTVTSWSFCAD
ncbi:MAG: hypothetical protein ACR2LC_00985 [Pyrinomonadaceae bacterium]